MRRIILLLMFINIFIMAGHAQTVRGIVLDKSNNIKINYASIYINGTYIGTNSDRNGYFELDITKYNSLPLTISAIGYYSATLTNFATDRIIEVYLTPKTYELKEVVVVAKSHEKERKANLRLFRSQFLGLTVNGRKCVITNEDDIKFVDSGNSLKAFTLKPILIINYELGYKITYYLDTFEFNRESGIFLIKGTALFNEDMSIGIAQKNIFEKRRKNAYLGSIFHFFSSLWANSLESNGFSIRDSEGEKINYKDLVTIGADSRKYLSNKGCIYIYYLLHPPKSYIEVLKDKVFFDSVGYFDGSGVKIIGEMAERRIGDLLPYDYKLK
jgi:CarboxypepD_reg-like domain